MIEMYLPMKMFRQIMVNNWLFNDDVYLDNLKLFINDFFKLTCLFLVRLVIHTYEYK